MTTQPSPDTVCAHGAPSDDADSAIVPPIVYSATFAARDAQEFAAMASQPRHARYYTRYGNPLHEQVAAKLVALEGASSDTHAALVTASGMGAISLVLLGLLKAGDHVVAQTNHYMASAKHFSELLPRFGVRCTLVDQTDLAQWERAIVPGTRLVMTETPVNPTCALTDLAAVARLARAAGALSAPAARASRATAARSVSAQVGLTGVSVITSRVPGTIARCHCARSVWSTSVQRTPKRGSNSEKCLALAM